MRHLPELIPSRRSRWWPPFLAGTAAGLLAGILVRRRSDPGRAVADREAGWDRWRDAWEDVVEGASDSLANARELVTRREPLDVERLQERLNGMECSAECRVRLLGEGIVEVVGACGSEDDARALLDELSAQPGVEVVVNRVWTPASSDPDGTASGHASGWG